MEWNYLISIRNYWKAFFSGSEEEQLVLVLSIGAPSSPIISNFILYRFDRIITEHCRKLGINYSRYADDLTFSTNEKDILLNFPSKVRKTLSRLYSGQIKVNLKKTVLSSKAHNRHVTGITLSNDGTLSVGREKKRKTVRFYTSLSAEQVICRRNNEAKRRSGTCSVY